MNELYYRYLEGCRNFNELNDLPEKGWEWHHTLPQCLFGDQPFGLWLTREQHAIASILQSFAFGRMCTSGWHKKDLPEKWLGAFKLTQKMRTKQHNQRISESLKGKSKTKEHRRKLSIASSRPKPEIRGEKHGMWGKKHPKETLERISAAAKGALHWVNCEGKTCRSRECPGPEWQRGRKWSNPQ